MALAEGTTAAIASYVEIRAQVFHQAFQWMLEQGYTRAESQHFATMTTGMMFMDTSQQSKADDVLRAQMQRMTPGGNA